MTTQTATHDLHYGLPHRLGADEMAALDSGLAILDATAYQDGDAWVEWGERPADGQWHHLVVRVPFPRSLLDDHSITALVRVAAGNPIEGPIVTDSLDWSLPASE